MDIKTIAPDLSVSSQITAQDVGIAASQGFRSVIINRPNGESADQPGCDGWQCHVQSQDLRVDDGPKTLVGPQEISVQVDRRAEALRDQREDLGQLGQLFWSRRRYLCPGEVFVGQGCRS